MGVSNQRSRHIYFLKENLLHAISQLPVKFHVVTKFFVYTLSSIVHVYRKHTLDLCQVVTNRSLKTMENLKLIFVSPQSGCGCLRGMVVYQRLLTKTLIIPDITKNKSSNVVLLYMFIFLKKITTNTLQHRTQSDIYTLRNHALHMQPTDKSLIYKQITD